MATTITVIAAAVAIFALAVACADANRMRLSYQEREENGTLIGGVASAGSLTVDTLPTDGDTMTIDATTYTFKTTLTGGGVLNEIKINAADLPGTQLNILGAINGNSGVPGTDYSAGQPRHASVTIAAFAADVAVVTARTPGVAGDSIVTTETFTAGTNVFDAATLGTTVAGAAPIGEFTRLPITSESLAQATESQNSAIIRDDRQIRDVVRSGIQAEGDVGYEFISQVFDPFIEAALQSAQFTEKLADLAAVTTIEAISTDTFRSSVNHAFANLAAGSMIRVSGFVNAANNGFFRVSAVIDGGGGFNNELTVEGATLVTEAAGPAVTFEFGEYVTNGTRIKKFDLEKEFTDLAAAESFAFFDGMLVNSMSLDMAADAILTGTIGFVGQKEVSAVATAATVSLTEPPENPVLNAVDDVLELREGGLASTAFEAVSFGIAIGDNLRPRKIIGLATPSSFGAGTFDLTGTLTAFFQTKAVLDKYLAFTESELWAFVEDADGVVYVIEIPRVKYTTGTRVAGGQNTDVIADLAFSAFRDDVKGYTLRIHRIV